MGACPLKVTWSLHSSVLAWRPALNVDLVAFPSLSSRLHGRNYRRTMPCEWQYRSFRTAKAALPLIGRRCPRYQDAPPSNAVNDGSMCLTQASDETSGRLKRSVHCLRRKKSSGTSGRRSHCVYLAGNVANRQVMIPATECVWLHALCLCVARPSDLKPQ
jgi:hypothetical protein